MNRIAIFFKQAISPEGSSVKEFLWQYIMYYSVCVYMYTSLHKLIVCRIINRHHKKNVWRPYTNNLPIQTHIVDSMPKDAENNMS